LDRASYVQRYFLKYGQYHYEFKVIK